MLRNASNLQRLRTKPSGQPASQEAGASVPEPKGLDSANHRMTLDAILSASR